jgi:hypothetical protein
MKTHYCGPLYDTWDVLLCKGGSCLGIGRIERKGGYESHARPPVLALSHAALRARGVYGIPLGTVFILQSADAVRPALAAYAKPMPK